MVFLLPLQHFSSLLALLLQVLGRLTAGHSTTSHDHDDILGLWVAIIGIEGVAHASLLLHQPGEFRSISEPFWIDLIDFDRWDVSRN